MPFLLKYRAIISNMVLFIDRSGLSSTTMQRLRSSRLLAAFSPHIPRTRFPPAGIIHRQSFHRTLVVSSRTSAPAEHFMNPCLDCYRTEIDIDPLSWYDLSEVEFFVQRVMKIQGTIRPLAFLPESQYLCIVFEAGSNYYSLDTCNDCWKDFGGDFASDDEFLVAFTGPARVSGKKYYFPDDTNELYAAVCEEQQKAVKKAGRS
ncbi:hypothetical protein MSAN_00876900 [Mycena sanguinolenta]|uniref:Uncharacterized protein n=1 Tax=Mycena sanguinolenta TaxID=230812 RepID=A0A8H6Z001_9AGAR|nr:hypothetical protein MSAN_00876900 [Mycena sanguinolenta]